MRLLAGLFFGLLPSAALAQEKLDKAHTLLYRKVAPATVFVTDGVQKGSGVLIDPSGIVLTSPTACGSSGESVTVVLGHKRLRGKVLGRVTRKELALVKIDGGPFPFVELGDSDAARPGQVSYVLGDCFESIQRDGQPALSMGVISGIYEVTKKQRGTYYTGKVLETSAAVNPDQDGGPLVDRQGRLLGIVTLNYDESKFTGIAIPINELKADIARLRGAPGDLPAAAILRKGPGWLGLPETRDGEGGLLVVRLSRSGPAEKAGLRKGDLLVSVGTIRLATRADLRRAEEASAPGEILKLTVVREGTTLLISAEMAARPLY